MIDNLADQIAHRAWRLGTLTALLPVIVMLFGLKTTLPFTEANTSKLFSRQINLVLKSWNPGRPSGT